MKTRQILSSETIDAMLDEMVVHLNKIEPNEKLSLVGIRARGVPLAERLAEKLARRTGKRPEIGILDITLYRDDFSEPGRDWPEVRGSDIPFPVSDRIVVLVDDVLYTGRTVRAALNALMDYGRPRAVRLAVLIDRGGRELPVQPDVFGTSVPTKPMEHVRVSMSEIDGVDKVEVLSPESEVEAKNG